MTCWPIAQHSESNCPKNIWTLPAVSTASGHYWHRHLLSSFFSQFQASLFLRFYLVMLLMDLFAFHGRGHHFWSKWAVNGGRRPRRGPLLTLFCFVPTDWRWVRGWVAVPLMRMDCFVLCRMEIWRRFMFCWRTNPLCCRTLLSMIASLRFILLLLMVRSRWISCNFAISCPSRFCLILVCWLRVERLDVLGVVVWVCWWELWFFFCVFFFVVIRSCLCFWNDLSIRICWIVTSRWGFFF